MSFRLCSLLLQIYSPMLSLLSEEELLIFEFIDPPLDSYDKRLASDSCEVSLFIW